MEVATPESGPDATPRLDGVIADVRSRRLRKVVLAAAAVALACAPLFFSIRPSLAPPKILNVTQLTHDGRFKTRLVTDGARIYFNTYVSAGTKISQVSVGGGEVTEVPNTRELVLHTPELGLLDVAADGTELLLGLDSMSVGELPLSLLPLPSGTGARVGNVLATDGALSPQGDRIAYFHAQELWIVQRDGTSLRKIAHVPGYPDKIRWSPDGLRLRFGMNCSIWEVQPDGKGLHELFIGWNHPSPECSTAGDWTRDGKYYVFTSRRGGIRNLWVARDTKGLWHKVDQTPQQFTAGAMQMYGVVPSRDGNRLFAVGGTPRTEIVCFDPHTRQFVGCLFDLSATELNFSRDGRWLTYVDSVDSTLWRSKADGTERLQLSPAGMHAMRPQFSPNGKQIAFAGSRPNDAFHFYRVSIDGGNLEQLTNGENDERWLSWSPDGDTIAFGIYDDINADKQNLIHFLHLPTRRVSSLPGTQELSFPEWSPDGRYIAAISVKDFKPYVIDPKSGKSTGLGDKPADRLSWSTDSHYVYFNSYFAGEPAICRVSVSTHKVEGLASLAGVNRAPWSWTGLAPDGRLLAVRSLSNYEIYAIDWQAP